MGGPFDTYFLEADAITGPYRMITYMPAFGPAAYFGNIPVRKTPRFSPFYTKHDHFTKTGSSIGKVQKEEVFCAEQICRQHDHDRRAGQDGTGMLFVVLTVGAAARQADWALRSTWIEL